MLWRLNIPRLLFISNYFFIIVNNRASPTQATQTPVTPVNHRFLVAPSGIVKVSTVIPNTKALDYGFSSAPPLPSHLTVVNPPSISLDMLQKEFIKISCNTDCATKNPASQNDDIEVSVETLSFSCPLSLGRIVHPAKGTKCTHKQCFDLPVLLDFYPNQTNFP